MDHSLMTAALDDFPNVSSKAITETSRMQVFSYLSFLSLGLSRPSGRVGNQGHFDGGYMMELFGITQVST